MRLKTYKVFRDFKVFKVFKVANPQGLKTSKPYNLTPSHITYR